MQVRSKIIEDKIYQIINEWWEDYSENSSNLEIRLKNFPKNYFPIKSGQPGTPLIYLINKKDNGKITFELVNENSLRNDF